MTVSSLRTTTGVVAVAVVAAAVVYGFTQIGPPRDERERRLDERRVDDLQGLARAVDLHWTRHGGLPTSLQELSDGAVRELTLNDPERDEHYEYRVETASAFELCGVFGTNVSEPSADVFWTHPVGRHCFNLEVREVRRDADQDRSPVNPRARP